MRYEQVQQYPRAQFKRLCGVMPETFEWMLETLQRAQKRKKLPGRPSKLSVENQLLLTLQYWREYRTYFHIAAAWGIHESSAYRVVRKVENQLMASGRFRLLGKKSLTDPDQDFDVVIVDVTETPIERPKKNKSFTTAASKDSIPSKLRWSLS